MSQNDGYTQPNSSLLPNGYTTFISQQQSNVIDEKLDTLDEVSEQVACEGDNLVVAHEFVEVKEDTQYANRPRTREIKSPVSPEEVAPVIAQYWLDSLQQSGAYSQQSSGLNIKQGSGVVDQWAAQDHPRGHGWANDEAELLWSCDEVGGVVWFQDQNGVGWSKASDNEEMFRSEDGGERISKAVVTDDACLVEDSDGCIMTISFDGSYSIKREKKSREDKMRSLMQVFGRVDANGDDRLSLAEIETALEICDEKDRELINSLRIHYKRIEWTRRGMFGQGAQGLSLREILDFTCTGERSENDINELLLSQMEAVIDFVDHRQTGHVDPEALRQGLSSLRMPQRLRQSIEVLLKRCEELSLLSAYGFSPSDWKPTRQAVRLMLIDLYKQIPEKDSTKQPDWANLEIQSREENLFVNNDALRSISVNAFNNCVEADQTFMALAAAIIVHNPEFVIRTVRPSDNGAFVVTFPGDRNMPVRVILPPHKEIFEYGLAGQYGIWAMILARGFAEYLEQKRIKRQWFPETKDADFRSIQDVAALLTTNEVSRITVKGQPMPALAKAIDELWAQGRMMVLCRYPDNGVDDATVVLHHTCAITGWDPQSGLITLTNPNAPASEKLSVDDLSGLFNVLIFE